jgi:murein DD-endopeptidase MepM/ murein hydrolase activator NlpD
MFKLIKKLFSTTDGRQTVVFVDDDGTRPSRSFRLKPGVLWMICISIFFAVVIVTVVLLRFTPLGGLVDDRGELRTSVIAIQQKVATLQDTINAQNMQLNAMQSIIVTGEDTTFRALPPPESQPQPQPQSEAEETAESGAEFEPEEKAVPDEVEAESQLEEPIPIQPEPADIASLPADAVLISNLLETAPEFPAAYPVGGTPTRTFDIEKGHYGLDIAASDGDSFKSVAAGVIINQEWTFNYGFVIMIQHANEIISLYKHAQTVNKGVGETVQQGDILGTIGDVGMLSSGPHIHIEIWEGGIPQNPKNYLINPK